MNDSGKREMKEKEEEQKGKEWTEGEGMAGG